MNSVFVVLSQVGIFFFGLPALTLFVTPAGKQVLPKGSSAADRLPGGKQAV